MEKVADFEERVWAKLFYEIGVARLIEENPNKNVQVSHRSRVTLAETRNALIRMGAW